jgi:hypothetical protein
LADVRIFKQRAAKLGKDWWRLSAYSVTMERGDTHWLLHVEGDGFDQWTQARRPGEADAMVRDLVAMMTGADPKSIETVQPQIALRTSDTAVFHSSWVMPD